MSDDTNQQHAHVPVKSAPVVTRAELSVSREVTLLSVYVIHDHKVPSFQAGILSHHWGVALLHNACGG